MRYITFTKEMARAYAEGRKKMTRRVIKWPKWLDPTLTDTSLDIIADIINSNEYRGVVKGGIYDGVEHQFRCPYGCPGDQIILGTTWAVWEEYDNWKPRDLPVGSQIWSYFDGEKKPEGFGKLRPARFLPLFLRHRMPTEILTVVLAERVQDITEDEAVLEGVDSTAVITPDGDDYTGLLASDLFPDLWDSINAKRGYGWDSNPFVWVLGW